MMPNALQDIALQRLYNQQVAQTSFSRPDELLAWLGAVQGQDYAGAKWALGLRLPGSTDAAIEQTIAEQKIVRSWVFRGTLHLVAAADMRWMLALVAQRLISGSARRYHDLELDDATLARSTDLLAKTLQGGHLHSRPELFAVLAQNGLSTAGQRGVHMLQRASLEGLICQGVTQRNQPTFFALDELPASRAMTRDEALAELARRYFISRGPATVQDFAWWSGLSLAEARVGLESVRGQLIQAVVEGQVYYLAPTSSTIQDMPLTAYLLPGFDEYLLAYKDRRAALDEPHYKRSTPTNGMLPNTIVVDGRVVGTWKRTLKKAMVTILPELFHDLSADENSAFRAAAERYAKFLDLRLAQ
jgi:hypothetical protein